MREPSSEELEWLEKYIAQSNHTRILQIGGGVATKILHKNDIPLHIVVEDNKEEIEKIKDLPITILNTWDYESYKPFDLIYVDSSAGCNTKGVNRDKAIEIAEDSMADGCHVIIHDYNHRMGENARKYLESHNYTLISSFNNGKGYGVFQKGETQSKIQIDLDFITDYNDLTVVTACDTNHIVYLEHSLPTWVDIKKLICPIIVYANGIDKDGNYEKDGQNKTTKILDYNNVKIIPWDMTGAETQREKMLSAFIFGPPKDVETKYWLKLDSDTNATAPGPFLLKSHFRNEIVAQPWGYTRPANMIPRVDYWLDGLQKIGMINTFKGVDDSYIFIGDENNYSKLKHKARRTISYIRLTNNNFIKLISSWIIGNRMPVSSEDTLVWRICERLGFYWDTFRFSDYGWEHKKRSD